jgi:hypothetical protein
MNTITITVDMTPENLEILKQLCPQPVDQPAEQPVKKTRKKKTEAPVEAPKEEAPAEKPAPPKEEAKKYTAIDVKAVCLKLSKAGKQDLLRATFAKFGGKKLSDIKPEDYPALMDELAAGGAENA